MIVIELTTPSEMQKIIAQKARAVRLELNLSQLTLSKRSGVSYGSLKKFEQTGQISLESLLRIALVLESMDGFKELFNPALYSKKLSLNDLIKDNTRKRGRK
jgi:transcriptional regulator with XRE-family HTH domain